MGNMSFKEAVRRAKQAPKKNIMIFVACMAAVIALTIYYFAVVLQ